MRERERRERASGVLEKQTAIERIKEKQKQTETKRERERVQERRNE